MKGGENEYTNTDNVLQVGKCIFTDLKNYNKMKENKEKFKQFVIEQLKDYDEWREASPDGYAELITNEAVKLFCQPDVIPSLQHSDDMCFHECPNCSCRCNCQAQPCSCCNEV